MIGVGLGNLFIFSFYFRYSIKSLLEIILYLGITSVGRTNPYVIFFLSSIAEFIGYSLCSLNDKFGRKRMLALYFGLAGLSCLLVAFTPTNDDKNTGIFEWNKMLVIISASFGKSMASAATDTAYIYTSQSYPTNVRGTMFLFSSSLGRFGKIKYLQIVRKFLHFLFKSKYFSKYTKILTKTIFSDKFNI